MMKMEMFKWQKAQESHRIISDTDFSTTMRMSQVESQHPSGKQE